VAHDPARRQIKIDFTAGEGSDALNLQHRHCNITLRFASRTAGFGPHHLL